MTEILIPVCSSTSVKAYIPFTVLPDDMKGKVVRLVVDELHVDELEQDELPF